MLSQIDLHYFKCFDLLRLPLSQLTLLTGTNASGKSSVLQALVLLHQTMQEQQWSTRLILNGNTLRMGTVRDVLDQINGGDTLEIGVTDETSDYLWVFAGERTDMSMRVEKVVIGEIIHDSPQDIYQLLPIRHGEIETNNIKLTSRLASLTYLTAERIGPREAYPLQGSHIVSGVGPTGEYAVSQLHIGRDEAVLDDLVISGTSNKTRLYQTQERMRMFFPGCSLDVQQIPRTNTLLLGVRTSDETDFHRPANVGFGITQVFPIVVAALSANKDDILLIENPEVHLHPAGQALMGRFLAEVANAGVQVILETHSDHILNGVRRAVKSKEIDAEKVAIHFFQARGEGVSQVTSPIIDDNGNIDAWPAGFFDQFDRDANYFAGWGS